MENPGTLGARLRDGGAWFSLWAPTAELVEVSLIAEDCSQINHAMMAAGDGIWEIFVPGIEAGQLYGFRVHGEWNPAKGLRANPSKLLVDPYAHAITGDIDYDGAIYDHSRGWVARRDAKDSTRSVPFSVVVADSAAPEPIAKRKSLAESVIYEMHVAGYTKQHPLVPKELRGTYAGLASEPVIEELKSLGVTAIELLPVHHFVSEPFLIDKGLTNYWGYNTLGFFAPHASYCSTGSLGEQVQEFKDMVTALHRAGIEVILDVVYNHTCEGGPDGPTLSFRGIDHRAYYRLTSDLAGHFDVTGCGNSVNSSNEGVLDFILDSMRYWVRMMGVDGFRFDLATTIIRDENHHVSQEHAFKRAVAEDPAFAGIKMIVEPWDIGPYGYQVGRYGKYFSEWNDQYRDAVRDFWRGAGNGVRDFATRISGSSDLYYKDGGQPTNSINYVTAHDGFTLRDLVSYGHKHNEANLEDNRDGSDNNRSWNCGAEGETDDPVINALRQRQAKNILMTLLLSKGVPMITAGDEAGRTQQGNNNAYCQDNEISWVDWQPTDWTSLKEFVAQLISIRSDRQLGKGPFPPDTTNGALRPEYAWFGESGTLLTNDNWSDSTRRFLGNYQWNGKSGFLTYFYAGDKSITVTLPPPRFGNRYELLITSANDQELRKTLLAGESFALPAHTCVLFAVS